MGETVRPIDPSVQELFLDGSGFGGSAPFARSVLLVQERIEEHESLQVSCSSRLNDFGSIGFGKVQRVYVLNARQRKAKYL